MFTAAMFTAAMFTAEPLHSAATGAVTSCSLLKPVATTLI
jgi:hypothetical protein